MTTHISNIILFLCTWCFMCTACKEDISSSTGEEQGSLVLSYSVGGSEVYTRTEGGWEDWNENKIVRLDLFVFRGDARIAYYGGDMDTDAGDAEATQTWNIPLAAWNAAGNTTAIQENDVVYLIANHTGTTNLSSISTLSGLQAVTVTGLVCNKKQETFVMDGKIPVTSEMILDASNITLGVIPLKRAAAKIRVKFASQTEWSDVSYRFYHYVTSARLLEPERETEDAYLAAMQTLPIFPEENEVMATVNVTSTDADNNYYEDGKQLVFYSYANNWFDENKWEDVNQIDPIVRQKQTYLLLYAPYDGEWYYYKVPVNKTLPDNFDDVNLAPDDYKHLYRLQRNHIYDITVTIDRKGGTVSEPVTLTNLAYEVKDWKGEINIEVPSFD